MTMTANFSSSQVALVYPNSDPGMFWVAFYGCLLAEVIPVPIEVPLSRQVISSRFLSGISQCLSQGRKNAEVVIICCKISYLMPFY